MTPKDYPVEIRPLAADNGGGWLATFPDLPGCMGDGDTPEAAVADGYEAAQAWLSVAAECGDPIPKPGMGGESGRFVARVPKSLHTRLVARAAAEGVSMNRVRNSDDDSPTNLAGKSKNGIQSLSPSSMNGRSCMKTSCAYFGCCATGHDSKAI